MLKLYFIKIEDLFLLILGQILLHTAGNFGAGQGKS
jgi:hypothetical protein